MVEDRMHDGKHVKVWNDASLYNPNDVQALCITGAFPGIVIAGALYPVILTALIWIWRTIASGDIGVYSLSDFVLFSGMLILCGGCAGAFISAISGLISVALVCTMNWSVGNPIDARAAAISAGSLAGYMPTVLVLFGPVSTTQVSFVALVGFLGPILAMSMGALGAYWSAADCCGFDIDTVCRNRPTYRLTITTIMMGTFWIAIACAGCNFFGGPQLAIAAAGWFVLQAFMLLLVRQYRIIRKAAA